ncbi:MAG: tetratricopeptide repeat protein [Candidatus Omnitrophota bacterium]
MKRGLFVLTLIIAAVSLLPGKTWAYNYGDYRSATMTTKAWKALDEGDIEAVLAYTNKCLELYSDQAKKMQESLTDYPAGSNQDVFGYWALNDVATSLYIQGEAYRKADMIEEAKEAYQRVVDEFKFGQCWDVKGWFWKPAEAAQQKLDMLESGSKIDFGDYTSAYLTTQAWKALQDNDLDAMLVYTDKCLELYGKKAQEMQDSLTEYPWESPEKIFSFWALNDVGTCLFIKGEAYQEAGNGDEAKKAYKKLVDEFFYAQCWDSQGWFWKPAEAAQQKLDEMGE